MSNSTRRPQRIAALTQRPDLSADERSALQQLVAKWLDCKAQARDTIDVGRTDAPMATMMIGQTDDSFEAVDADLRKMSQALVAKANAVAEPADSRMRSETSRWSSG